MIQIIYLTLNPLSWASSSHFTTPSPHAQKPSLALSYIEDKIVLSKQMVKSVKLAISNEHYGRVEIRLTPEASEQIYAIRRSNKQQKLIFKINNQIADAINIQKGIGEDSFLVVISTSRKNADYIMRALS